ncbi:MAG TPA: hypothetical protein VGZ22_13945, partial [Isosphaeraceae bacterium]|nr:hypothetical protein [Isosphaeraceae bacterium]
MSSEGPSDPLQPRRKPNWWVRVTVVLAALQAACFLIPQMRPGLLGVILWGVGLEIVPGLAVIVLVIGLIWSVVRRPFWRRPRLVAFAGLVLLSCSGLAFQKYPSSHDYTPSQIRFRLPLDGPILV